MNTTQQNILADAVKPLMMKKVDLSVKVQLLEDQLTVMRANLKAINDQLIQLNEGI